MRIPFTALAVCAVFLSACSTIYVGNVPFTTVEVCSEELASRLHPRSGCLPPTRTETAQGFFLARYRLQVSPSEAANLSLSESEMEKLGRGNHLPSWIGRVFNTISDPQDGQLDLRVPSSGNLDFIPLGSETTRPEAAIRTEALVKTDLTGVVQKKVSLGGEINPAEVVDRALKFSGLDVAGIPPGLKSVLIGEVVKGGYERYSTDVGQGAYYYMSMTPEMLDSLTSALTLCNWRVGRDPGRQTADIIAPTVTPGEAFQLSVSAGTPVTRCFEDKLKDNNTIASGVKTLLKNLQETASNRPDLQVVGIVIGVAILQTKGQSEMCSRFELGLLAKKGMQSSLITPSCEQLRLALTNFAGTRPASTTPGAAPAGTPLSDEEKRNLLLSVQAEYARATYKALEIHPHTSVLAIHWVPVRLQAQFPIAKNAAKQ